MSSPCLKGGDMFTEKRKRELRGDRQQRDVMVRGEGEVATTGLQQVNPICKADHVIDVCDVYVLDTPPFQDTIPGGIG
ncbi:hypothetical protein Tco_1263223 [Tanacetum coccineum]